MTLPLITNADGTKFGKSLGGAIYLNPKKTSIYKFYQFWIRTDDRDVLRYLKYFTFLSKEEIEALERQHSENPMRAPRIKPWLKRLPTSSTDQRLRLRWSVPVRFCLVSMLPVFPKALSRRSSVKCQRRNWQPLDLATPGKPLVELLVHAGLCTSKGQARKDVEGGGVYVNNVREGNAMKAMQTSDLLFGKHLLLRKGKRNYTVLTIK